MIASRTIVSPFSAPRASARLRMRSCCHSQRKPSSISPRNDRVGESVAAPGRRGAKSPTSIIMSAADTAKVPASMKNGRANDTLRSRPATGGPTKPFITISAPHRRPLARSSCVRSTRDGISVCAELSRRTSAQPSNVAATYRSPRASGPLDGVAAKPSAISIGSLSEPSPARMTIATPTVSRARSASILMINLRRSARSVITPAGSVNSSHGRRVATTTPAIAIGSLVRALANHG